MARDGDVDAITADYLAEFNIAWKAIELTTRPDLGYEPNFSNNWHGREELPHGFQHGRGSKLFMMVEHSTPVDSLRRYTTIFQV